MFPSPNGVHIFQIQRKNRKNKTKKDMKNICNSYEEHMENENENENINKNIIKNESIHNIEGELE